MKFRDGGLSVEAAKAAMLKAGEGPGAPLKAIVDDPPVSLPVVAAEETFEDETPPTPAKAGEPTSVVAAQPVRSERVENDQFVAEISQDGGKWAATITYKKGGGTEKFEAASKTALMMQLLQGKGNATLRVKEAVRRERFGSPNLDLYYPLPDGTSTEDFDKMTEGQQKALIFTVASQQTLQFRDKHPEFYLSVANSEALGKFLQNHKPKLPITLTNLEFAFSCLSDAEELETGENKPPTIPAIATPALAQTDPAPVTAPAPAAPAAPAPAPTAAVVRKRGTTGLQPGDSSSPTEPVRTEADSQPRQPSEAELRTMPMNELKRIADADRRALSVSRR